MVCALIATIVRALHLGHGLPDLTEEAFPFRHALTLWGTGGERIDLNPHWFAYPSLTVYLQFLVQQVVFHTGHYSTPADFLLSLATDPSRAVVMGRSVAVIADVATLVLVGRITRRFGDLPALLAMGLVAVAPVMIQTSRLIYTDSVTCALSMAAIERLLAYREHGGWKRLVPAASLVGLAAGAKYPAVLLLVPLAIAIARRDPRPRSLTTFAAAAGIAGLAFLCTTPYLVTSWAEFVRDAVYMTDTSTRGGLGRIHGPGLSYYLVALSGNLGWIGAALMAGSLLTAARGPSREAARLLWLSWLVLFAPVASVPVEAERYLVPAIAVGACLVAAGCRPVLERLHGATGRVVAAGLVVLAGVQPAWAGIVAATSGRSTTQQEARRWCEAHLKYSDLLLSEAYGPNLLTYRQRASVMVDPIFRAASPSAKGAYASVRAYHLVWLPLLIGGYASVSLPGPDARELTVYPHAVDWNAAAYDLRLLRGVDYVATTAAVRGRFDADPARFREQARFYALLDGLAERAAVIPSTREVEGASITIYRLGPRARAEVAEAGSLDTLWWARTVPESFKRTVEDVLRGRERSAESIPGLPLWAQPLRAAYQQRYGRFAIDLGEQHAALGRWKPAGDLATAAVTIVPDDVEAVLLYARIGGATGKWADVQRVLDRSSAVLARSGAVPEALLLAREWARRQHGDTSSALHRPRTHRRVGALQ